MRMWNVEPKLMCNQHILGEHVEMHMFTGSIRKGMNIQGYINKGLVETGNIDGRHKELVEEMVRRGMKHNSKLIEVPADYKLGFINVKENLRELSSRCVRCKEKIERIKNEMLLM